MSILIRRPVPRRQALRGLVNGAAVGVALPFLDCFLTENGNAIAATGQPLPVRFGTWFWGLGQTPGYNVKPPATTTKGIEFLKESKALIPWKDQINYFGGFNMPLDGRSNYTHQTGWVALRCGAAPASGIEIPAPTLDLLISDHLGGRTRFPNIDCTAINMPRENYSARSTNVRANAEGNLVSLYARLFGPQFADPNKAEFKPDPRTMVRKSVLSAVDEQSKKFVGTLGANDRARLDEYFTSIRQLENQLAVQLEKPAPNKACVIPPAPKEVAGANDHLKEGLEVDVVIENHKLMSKILAMATACNQTNVFNMIFTDNQSHMRRPGQTYTHHLLTHEEPIDKDLGYQPLVFWFNSLAMEGFATFIQAFADIKEGDGTLLDNSLIFAASETLYARVHTIDGCPIMTAGKAGGRIKTGLHVLGNGDPITRVGLTAMQVMGLPIAKWGERSLQTSKTITEILA